MPLLLCRLQGIWDRVRKQYTLFDPAVHCVDLGRFQSSTFTNMGPRGMDRCVYKMICLPT